MMFDCCRHISVQKGAASSSNKSGFTANSFGLIHEMYISSDVGTVLS